MSTGRFISEDPIKDGLNWYAYCGGNPVVFWDPSGLSLSDGTYAFANSIIAGISYRQNNSRVYENSFYDGENIEFGFLYSAIGNGNVECIYYDGPFIEKEYASSLCWACCQVAYKYSQGMLTDLNNSAAEIQAAAIRANAPQYEDQIGIKSYEELNTLYGDEYKKAKNSYFIKQSSDVSFDNIYNYLNEANAPIAAIFATKDNMGVHLEAHEVLITGAYVMDGIKYISYYDPNNYLNNVVEYSKFCRYMDDSSGMSLSEIGIYDETRLY